MASAEGFLERVIAINPEGPNAESNIVVGIGSLLLGRPLRFDHAAGEPVVGLSETGFLRGDGNADGARDLSDAITTLSFLFLGGEAPACKDGADSDDNGQLEITDAVLLLGVLFLGTGELPPPYPACGPDPTGDDLGCRITSCFK